MCERTHKNANGLANINPGSHYLRTRFGNRRTRDSCKGLALPMMENARANKADADRSSLSGSGAPGFAPLIKLRRTLNLGAELRHLFVRHEPLATHKREAKPGC